MDIEQARRELADALAAEGGREVRLRTARQVLIRTCTAVLGVPPGAIASLADVRRAATAVPRPAKRACAVLIVHALAVPGLVPVAAQAELRALIEDALRGALLRCSYPFDGTADAQMQVLQRLHVSIDELLQPLEPTFPNWQGLYAG